MRGEKNTGLWTMWSGMHDTGKCYLTLKKLFWVIIETLSPKSYTVPQKEAIYALGGGQKKQKGEILRKYTRVRRIREKGNQT